VITHRQLSEYYDWLSRYVQLTNWLAYRDRFASFTMHKRLGIETAEHAGSRRTAGVEYVNDRVLAVADLQPGPRVLDAGCGFGGTIFHWQPRIGGRYEGITLSRVQLAVAQREARRRGIAHVCQFRVQSYDEPLGSGFDAVVAIESLIHSPDLRRTLANLSGALQSGGVLLLLDDMAVYDLDCHRPVEADLLRRHWGCARYWTYDDYRDALDRAGLSLIHEEDLSALMRPRREEILDRLERTYSFLHQSIPLPPARTVISAFLGGIALERLHGLGDVHYRLFVARKVDR
jgi:SAM-dependent methyltransferase